MNLFSNSNRNIDKYLKNLPKDAKNNEQSNTLRILLLYQIQET
jgi:hypothetical protein